MLVIVDDVRVGMVGLAYSEAVYKCKMKVKLRIITIFSRMFKASATNQDILQVNVYGQLDRARSISLP